MNHHACLNKFFRLVWSAARGGWMAVAETARGRGKSGTRRGRGMTAAALVGAGLSSLHGLALAGAAPPAPTQLPTGGQVVAGQATLHQGGATLAVQQASQRAVIDWKTFDLGSQARVDFLQPNASAVTLNRVLDANASQIFGRISAPGQVFITNPNGVLFGATAQVDVGGLVATTLALGNDDFMAGSTTFGAGATSVRGAAVVNQGTLGARLGGYIALLAPEVRNEGVIVARDGTVALAAGEQVTLQFDGRRPVAVRVDRAALDALVDNRHAIRADGGLVVLVASSANALLDTVISNSGTLRADTLAQRGGRIVLEGGALGVVAVSGTLQARGNAAGEVGGAVVASGDKVWIHPGARLDASGGAGGGSVLVGGGWHGQDPTIAQASAVIVAAGATLDASATVRGNGGTVEVWSDIANANGATRALGTFLANGGAQGGDGGRIETSGHWLDTHGSRGGAAAAHGRAGSWLFDPYDVTITSSTTTDTESGGTWTPSGDSSTILNTAIDALLEAGTSVTVTTGAAGAQLGDIHVESAITKASGNTDVTLTLQAANALVIDAPITNTGGSGRLHLALDADDDLGVHDGHGAIVLNSDIATGGGDIAFGTGATMVVNGVATLVGGDVTVAGSGLRTLSTAGGNVTFAGQLNSDALVTASPLAVQAGAGTVTFASAVGGLAPLASIDVSAGAVHLDGGSAVTTGAQAWNAPIASGAGIVLSGSQIALNGATTAFNGNVALTASAGEIQINADLAASSGDIALVAGGGVTGSGGIHLAGGAPTLTITQAGNSTYAGIVSGANAVVTKTGAGILGLSGTNTWAGGLNLAGGELELDSPDAIGSTGTIAFAGGTLRFSGANGVDYSPRFSNAPGQLYSIDTNNRGVEFNSVLGSVGGTMTKWGGDYLGLYANNTYDGGSTINAGTLFGGGASQGTTVFGSGPITVNAGARLWTDRSTLSNALVLNGGLLTGSNGFGERWLGNISVTADSTIEAQYYMEFGGAVTGSGQLTKTSGGTLLFTGADSRTASTIVNSGTLQIGNGTTGSIAGDIQVDSGANLRFNRTDSLTYGGTITGAGTVEQAGNNTLTLTGASTYTGATTLSNGALIVENDHPVLTTSGYFGPGILAIKPASTSFSSPFTFNTPTSSLGFLVLGWPGNTADIDVAIATSVSNLIYVIGGNIRLGANLSATAPGSLFYAVATGDIVQASGVTVSTNGGNILYQSDFDASGGGYIWLQGQGANTRITSAGGDITLTGGTNTTTGYAQGRATGNGNGITLDDATLDSGGGNIVLRGQGSTGAASPIANTDGTAFNTDGVRLYGSNLIDSGTGTLKIAGRAQGLNSSNGIELSTTGVSTLASASNAATAIELVGDSTNLAASDSFGLYTWGNTIAATGTGGVTLYGAGRDGGLVVAANASVLANGGSILLEGVRTTGSNTGLTIQGMVGQRAASVVPTSTSNIVLSADTLVVTGTVQASGALTLQPYSAGASVGVGGGAGTLQLPQSLFGGPVVNGFSHVTIGRADGTGTLEVGDFALGTPLTLLNGSGDIALTGALDLGAQTMTLAGNGNVAETGVGRITSARLFLDGSAGTYTLGATTNHVGTLAGNVDGVDFVNGGALTIGTVDGVDGIVAATGRIAVATTSGDLSVAKGVSTSSTAADAIVLDAGGSADPDTVAGGDIVLVASPRIAVGAGGRATLYTGSIAGSTGVVDLVGSGSGNFRYHSDEATANFTSALGSGTFAVFREQPTLTVTATDAGKTYDANAWSGGNGFTGAGYVNGDSAMLLTGTPAYGGAAQGRVDAGSAALGVGGLANGAGYAIAYVDGTLVVAPKVVTVSATKVYDGSTALVGAVSLDTGIAGQTLTYTGATSSNAHVAASGKYIAAITLADGTGLASNYTLPTLDAANAPVTITRQGVRAIGTIGGTLTKVYDGTDAAPGATLSTHVVYAIAGDTLAVDTSGWTVRYDGTHVVDTTAMVAQGLFPHLSVATTGSGSLASDYLLVAMAIPVTPGSITTKALGATAAIVGASTKVYDGTTVAAGATVVGSVSGAIAGDTIALDASGIALAYDGAHVAGTTAIVASGAATFAIGSSTAGSVASDYSFTAPSIANAAASIAPKALGATAAIGGTLGKVYDGTSAAIGAAVGGSVSGAISGDTLALDTSGIALAYDGTHVVGTTAIVASGASTFAIGSSTAGSVAGDYSFTAPTIANATASITAKALNATAAIGGTSSKVYDGTNVAAGATVSGSVAGAISGDTFALDTSGVTLAYDGTHVVGTTALVASGASTFAIGSSTAGSVASDYSFTAPTIANAAASITAKALNATAAIGGTPSKIYDGTNVATGATVAGSVTGAIAGDTLALDTRGVTLAYDGTHVVGTNAIVASGSAGLVIGASAVGSVASDYAFTPPAIADAQAAITPRAISVIAPAASKVVDGNTRASGTVSIGGAGLVAGELVTDATLTYDSPVPGTGKTVTPSAAVFGGSAVASDYAVAYVGNDAGAILPAEAVRLPTTLPTLPFRSSPALAPRIVSGPDAVAAADGGGGVRVTLVAPPTASAAGQVTVDASSTSFTFVLPGDLPAPTRVTLADGRALPGWLRFDAGSGRFAVDSAPADGLPLQVVATVRNERYVVTVRKTQR